VLLQILMDIEGVTAGSTARDTYSIGSHLRDLSNGIWQLEGSCSSQSASQIDSLIDNWEIAIRWLELGTGRLKSVYRWWDDVYGLMGLAYPCAGMLQMSLSNGKVYTAPLLLSKLFYNCKKFHRLFVCVLISN